MKWLAGAIIFLALYVPVVLNDMAIVTLDGANSYELVVSAVLCGFAWVWVRSDKDER